MEVQYWGNVQQRVLNIYSPSRRSKKGHRFRFVRFLDVKNIKELERRLDQIWVGNFKLWVNIPWFRNGELNREEEHSKLLRAEPKIQNRTYAEVVKGQYGIEVGGDAKAKQKDNGSRSHGRDNRGSSIRTDLRSKEKTLVWKEKGQGEQWPSMDYNVKEEEYSWLKGCYVGKVHFVEMVRNLQEKFYMESYFSYRIRAMGGKLVLLDCDDKEELKDLVEMASDWLEQWFEEVSPWTPEKVASERFVWIRCQGVPLNDFLPTFQSDSEEQESWMMESEEEDLGSDGAKEARGDNGRHKEAEVDDDDMASYWEESNDKPIAQALRGSEMTVDRVTDTLQKIQTEMEGDFKIDRELSGGKRGRFETSAGLMNEEEYLLGLNEHSKMRSKEESNKKEKYHQREAGSVNINNGGHEPFEIGYEREEDRLAEWIEGKAEGIPKKSKRRIRSCSLVYSKEGFTQQFWQERRGRRGRRRGFVENRAQPGFVASPTGEVAGESIGDNCIQNCNRSIKKLKERLKFTKNALKLWSGSSMTAIDKKIKEVEVEIEKLDKKGENSLLTHIDIVEGEAPGLDSFNFRFMKSMWDDIKTEVIGFVKEFQEQGRLVRGSNASFIVLIPKTENPQTIEEYRPISLIGVMYKVIAKLLASRLCKVLHKIIGEQQMAFIKGRQLVDGVVIANEVIDEAKRRRKKSFVFKVDFEKAYDKVYWNFIDYMLDRMAFSATWRRWIQECLKSSMVSILINGSPTRQFPVTKGIRQGDPLSPFLFLIVVEGLNGLMTVAIDKKLYKGVEVGKDTVTVIHLQFVDDTIFFGEASEQNVRTIKCILRTFEMAAGLKINFGKCQLMGIGVDDDWRNKMAYRLGCKEGEFPIKYLGIPIGGNHRRLKMWQPLLDSVTKKLLSWKGWYLSQGGRITLINSVLSSLPVFLMSVYLIPKGTLNSIDKIRRNFLWGGKGVERKINWVKWDMICKDKEYEGLGVKDLKKFNLALVGKWWGRLATEEEGLWKRVIRGKYGGGGGHWQNWVRNGNEGGSLWWSDVQRINNAKRDNVGWLAKGFRLKMGEGKEEEESAYELSKMIEEVKMQPGITDKWEWVHKRDGKYSSSSAYSLLLNAQQTPNEKCFKRIWNHSIPSKIAAFNWRVVLDKIPTKKNLLKKGIDSVMDDVKCRLCEEEDEDSAHLFLRCKVAKWIWKECAKWWGISIRMETD
ncbi:hypothetical protein SLEP1_g23150 [Rubroshorea leprosula]|uniref:Reverse transcriptase domain-containing protein n=1 Tax=Rubroshorea leprosula TaxID=152421 RepID=A0AAV5JHL0_9ROSI|nr:hypothetical protein SLEP1_g23150 [Rubroshorea leprosula]